MADFPEILQNPLLLATLEIADHALVILLEGEQDLLAANPGFEALAQVAKQSPEQLAEWLGQQAGGEAFAANSSVELLHPTLGKTHIRSRRVEVADREVILVAIRRLSASQNEALSAGPDLVTSLPDRRALEEQLAWRFEKPDRPFALLFVDLDGFKQVNDTLGHVAGDRTLREVAQRFRAALRDQDVIARFGGDEFVVLIDGVAQTRDLAPIVRRLEASVNEPLAAANSLPLSASIGAAVSTDGYDTPEAMLHAADRRMYEQKKAGSRV